MDDYIFVHTVNTGLDNDQEICKSHEAQILTSKMFKNV